jgi:heat shock protein HslJ
MKKILSFTLLLVVFVACSSKTKYELAVNIENNNSLRNRNFVVTQKIDGNDVFTDTLKIKGNTFSVKIPYDGQALLFVSIPETNVNDVMLAAEEGIISLNINGHDVTFGGTPLNDRLQAFNFGTDSVSQLFTKLDEKYQQLEKDGLATAETNEQYTIDRRQLLKENTDRIIAFTKENVDNPIGEYYFYNNYYMYSLERKLELNLFASDKIKKQLGIE